MMSNLQLYLALGFPTLTVLVGILLNWSSTRNLRGELTGRMDRMDDHLGRIDHDLVGIQSDLRTFYSVTGRLEGRMDELSKRG